MKKLKSDRSITGLIPAIASLLIFALSTASFGIEIGLNVLGMVVISYALAIGLWPSIRTGNPYYLVSFFYMLVLGSFFIILEPGMLKRYGGRLDSLGGFLVILIYFFFLWLVFLLINKKLKWRGREIMELVAVDVMEGEDSYTDRPRPVGKIAGSRSDFIGFAKYLRRNLVFMSVEEGDRVILVPVKMGQETRILFGSNIDSMENTRVTIDFDGNVSVHISQKDYLDYVDDLSFHQLCESLGNLVIDFYDQYIHHKEIRIMDRVNSVKVGYFS